MVAMDEICCVSLCEFEQGGPEVIVIVDIFFQVVAEYFYALQGVCGLFMHCLGDLVGRFQPKITFDVSLTLEIGKVYYGH